MKDREDRPIPTAADYFRAMLRYAREEQEQRDLHNRTVAIEIHQKAVKLARHVLNLPPEERREVAGIIHSLAKNDPEAAFRAFSFLKEAKVLPPRTLRKEFGLPAGGSIFPRRK